ncbi:hypothetical protein C4D60_Mb00t10380 [Musa balbisiana]|uniref:NADH-ubiquinone oxidoreductase chain 1 n=1 Tax=Musa balbisiana TaxID=52838 RepID=A0A4S8I1S0_MUSBA|nr:hypothetical protein C4D60_Mb00t10380 [Musa balbisiana]
MAFVQRRKGPDVVGLFGLLQPLADGFKLILKEPISPSSANFSLFRMAPVATFTLSLVARAVVPFSYGMVLSDPNIGLLYLFAISSLGVYGIIIAGWSSNIGSGRSVAYDRRTNWSNMDASQQGADRIGVSLGSQPTYSYPYTSVLGGEEANKGTLACCLVLCRGLGSLAQLGPLESSWSNN